MNSEQFLSHRFVKLHPVEAARILEQLPVEDTISFLYECPTELAAKSLQLMNPVIGAHCLEGLSPDCAALIMANVSLEITAVLLRRMEESQRSAILESLPNELSGPLALVLQYTENTAGALMEPQALTLLSDLAVQEALKQVRRYAKHIFYHIPVTDRQHVFLGFTNIRKLMLAAPKAPISSVISTGVGRLSPNTTREAILNHPDWRFYHDLPVVDDKGVFLGVIGYQVVRRLESELHKSPRSGSARDAGFALGELYWLGMSAFFRGATSAFKPDDTSE